MPAVQATRERPHPDGCPPAAAFLDPGRDRLRVGPHLPAQPGERLVQLALRRALEEPSDLGQQVGPAIRQRLELGYRGGLLVGTQFTSLSAMPGLPR